MKLDEAYRRLVRVMPRLRETGHALAAGIGRSRIVVHDRHHPAGFAVDGWPINTLACCSLSGQLGICLTTGDLLRACVHYFQHLSAGRVFNFEDFDRESDRISNLLAANGVIRPEHNPAEVP